MFLELQGGRAADAAPGLTQGIVQAQTYVAHSTVLVYVGKIASRTQVHGHNVRLLSSVI
jgi:hypothetical protein